MNKHILKQGDCLELLKEIATDSVDAIITDFPYNLNNVDPLKLLQDETIKGKGFMNKAWDNLPTTDALKEMLRVLKPGAFLMSTFTPRQDKVTILNYRLLQAGFFISFSPIIWAYACLSDDTEILTRTGWERIHIPKKYLTNIIDSDSCVEIEPESNLQKKEILIYDNTTDHFKFEIPSRWSVFSIEDTCFRIKSDSTDQLVTRGHRCLVEREGKLLWDFVERLSPIEKFPILANVPYLSQNNVQAESAKKTDCLFKKMSFNPLKKQKRNAIREKSQAYQTNLSNLWQRIFCQRSVWKQAPSCQLLQSILQWKGTGKTINRLQQRAWNLLSSVLDRCQPKELSRKDVRPKQSCMERRHYVHAKERILLQRCFNKIREVSTRIYQYGSQRWICYGTSVINSSINREAIIKNRSSSSRRSQSPQQQTGKLTFIQEQCSSQKMGTQPKSYQTTSARITPEWYRGVVFCPTVSTGCFVARRNGKIFITGNSGFTKAANISKLIDKQKGATTEGVILQKYRNRGTISKPATPEAQQFEGSYAGFQPKPCFEQVVVAIKPLSEKTYVAQALKNGKGVTFLDDCRIPFQQEDRESYITKRQSFKGVTGKTPQDYPNPNVNFMTSPLNSPEQLIENSLQGRCVPNLLVSDDVLNTGKVYQSGDRREIAQDENGHKMTQMYGKHTKQDYEDIDGDSGSFSRYFDLDAWFAEKLKSMPLSVQKTFPFLIVPKPSTAEKNKGLNQNHTKTVNDGRETPIDNPFQRGETERKNTHPTVKSIKLYCYLVTLASRSGDLIIDPYCGSGTTLIAAVMLGRDCIGLDIDKESLEIAQDRLNAWTEQQLFFFTEEQNHG